MKKELVSNGKSANKTIRKADFLFSLRYFKRKNNFFVGLMNIGKFTEIY